MKLIKTETVKLPMATNQYATITTEEFNQELWDLAIQAWEPNLVGDPDDTTYRYVLVTECNLDIEPVLTATMVARAQEIVRQMVL